MKRMIVAGVLLVLIFFGWAWEEMTVEKICGDTQERLDEIEKLILEGKDITKDAMNLEEIWSKNERRLDIIVPHDETDVISVEVVRLLYHAEAGDGKSAILAVREIREYITEIERKLKVNLTNIF